MNRPTRSNGALHDSHRSRFGPVAIGLLILLGAILSSACPARDGDDDRPPIIISSGSVDLNVSPGTWTKDTGNHYKQKDAKGKSVKSFSATTGTCTVSGDKMMVVYGSSAINFEPKQDGSGKKDADVEFTAAAVVSQPSPSVLRVQTSEPLVSVTNGGSASSDVCAVVDQKITIRQVH